MNENMFINENTQIELFDEIQLLTPDDILLLYVNIQ